MPAAQPVHDSWLDLDGAANVRDLGGLAVRGGGHTRFRRLIRAGTLQELSPKAVDVLINDIGLRTVVDLRVPAEAEREGSALLGIDSLRFIALPVISADAIRSDAFADPRDMDVVDHYMAYLRGSGELFVTAAREFATPDELPAIFHCAAGKDRTGVLAAVILDAIGVEPEAIIADYTRSAERLDAIVEQLSRLPTYREMKAFIRDYGGRMSPDGSEMGRFLGRMQEEYGGAAAYLLGNGLTQDELDLLTRTLVEPSS